MLKRVVWSSAAAAGAAAMAAAYFRYQNNALQIGRYRIFSDIKKPLRVLCIADLHGKSFGGGNRRLLSEVRLLYPDVIVFPGDTISADCKAVGRTLHTLRELCGIAPCFLIPGNHELRSGKWEQLSELISGCGVTVLQNSRFDGIIKGVPVHILGLCEGIAVSRADYLKAAAGTLCYPRFDKELSELSGLEGAKIVLSHFPECFVRGDYCRYGFDLMVSGHAHGGQFRLNRRIGLFAPGQGVFPRFCQGVYGSGPRLLVSRGLGNDSPLPRVNNRPELALATLCRAGGRKNEI